MEEKDSDAPNSAKSHLKDLLPDGEANHLINRFQGYAAIFNGLGIGLFLGLLLGLSVSPVVSGVIGTISSLLAILVGLNEKFLDPIKSLRIGAFGLFSVLGILLGLYIRANDPFSPSLADKVKTFTDIGYTENEARGFVTGFIQSDSTAAIRQANVLYSSALKIQACDFLVYASSETPVPEVFNTFNTAGGIWAQLSSLFKKDLSDKTGAEALLILRDEFCENSTLDGRTIMVEGEITKLNQQSNLEEMTEAFENSNAPWSKIIKKLNTQFNPDERVLVIHSLIKIFNHE
ncbi:hypothetical protein [Cyclobacterium amurskyense]|uniref:Uncharacterized protein n=1 Tax=Cyclobacterium amurskyense TaxID=320787 RepID=A0A0H4PCQ7_9BACT|nr:hypothetical protein [Cyclobacterium amurskyense]AKP52014.1 hypothetical protein CA2015_2603 [Cyclobacterium amurskyense]